MNNTNHLEKISKKCKNFSSFLHFVRKKIISLQEINKSSVLAIILALENSTFSKFNKKELNARKLAGLLSELN